jgi:ribose 5-phosphate isomerase B
MYFWVYNCAACQSMAIFSEQFPVVRMVESGGFYLAGVNFMKVAVACDHAGYPLKEMVLEAIRFAGCEPLDLGAKSLNPLDDYPDYAVKVGTAIQDGKAQRGILLCGSGVGACIAANKMKGIYAGICHDTYSGHQGVEHDDMNVLCLGPRVIGMGLAHEIITAFLSARFVGNDPGQERHARRVAKIRQLES